MSPSAKQPGVFLNFPYDQRFRRLYVAYIAGVSCFGVTPRAPLEIPGGKNQLDRIIDLLEMCDYSIHDLSRVQLNHRHPPTPRFNMPFELGMAVELSRRRRDRSAWFVFEEIDGRLEKSLSDLKGTAVHIHGGTPEGIFRELCDVFVRADIKPSIGDIMRVYRELDAQYQRVSKRAGGGSPFRARVFHDLVLTARAIVGNLRIEPRTD